MGAIAAIVVFCLLFTTGIAATILGIVGLAVSLNKNRSGSRSSSLPAISSISLAIGLTLVLIPLAFFTFILTINLMPPSDFVETDIVIEENGYQDTRFTADGVVYEVLDFEANDYTYIENPIFTYKTEGFLNRSQRGNYYKVENPQGFNIVADYYGLLFCPTDERARITEYYTDIENLCFLCESLDYEVQYKTSPDETVLIYTTLEAIENNIDTVEKREVITSDFITEFSIWLVSNDGTIFVKYYTFAIFEGDAYYVSGTDFSLDDDDITYTLIKLPDDVLKLIKNIHQID